MTVSTAESYYSLAFRREFTKAGLSKGIGKFSIGAEGRAYIKS